VTCVARPPTSSVLRRPLVSLDTSARSSISPGFITSPTTATRFSRAVSDAKSPAPAFLFFASPSLPVRKPYFPHASAARPVQQCDGVDGPASFC
jgi:hypothetical protein